PSSTNSLPTACLSRRRAKARRRLATPSTLASVINGSATRRRSLALGRVVRISSCLISDAAMFLNMASRWELVRLSLRPDLRWRMDVSLSFYRYERPAPASDLPRLPAIFREWGIENRQKPKRAFPIPYSRFPASSTQLHAAGNSGRRPVFQLGAEREALGAEHVLDLGERLLAEVRCLQQLDLGLLDQVADVVDALGLETVGRAHGEFQVVDRAQQQRRNAGLVLLGLGGFATLEIAEHGQLVVQGFRGLAHGVINRYGAVGLDIENQLVEVGALLDARGVDRVGHAAHRAERRIDLQPTDRAGFLVGIGAADGRLVADAATGLEAHVQRHVLGKVADHVLGVDDLHRVVGGDVAGRDHALALLRKAEVGFVGAVEADRDALEVQQHLDHVFLQAFQRGVFVQHAVDFRFDDRRTGDGRQQHAPQRVAERVAVTALQRLDNDAGMIGANRLDLEAARTQDVSGRDCHGLHSGISLLEPHRMGAPMVLRRTVEPPGLRRWRRSGRTAETAPAATPYFEYNSTISASLMSLGRSPRSGMALNTPAAFFASNSIQPGRRSMLSETFMASCTRNCFCALSVSLISSPGRITYDGTLTFLPLTITALCETSWRACARVTAKPMRYTTLSRRASSRRNRFSPVLPLSWVAFL